MTQQYKRYVPQNVGELIDLLGSMMLSSPTFKDETGFFPERDIDTTFEALSGGLERVRLKIGDDRYAKLVALAQQMRAHFEADPHDVTEDSIKGRGLIREMENILRRNDD